MPNYLRQWFIHLHGGEEPVQLVKGSVESKMLQRATVPLPEGYIPARKQEGEVAIALPYYRSHDPRTYNHITETGKRAMVALIKNAFDVDVWEFLHDFGRIGTQQKDLIYLFMEQRGIQEDGTTWDSIAKVYQRLRKCYLTQENRKKKQTTSQTLSRKRGSHESVESVET